ncbi:MAG: hypothetical protein HOI23_02190, partial [Deltaproteobacteria bacterium]|nr:hypothetical protein [Deltaproteobacteria bacterium]
MNRFFFSSICVLALALGGCGGDDERPSTDPGDTNNGSGDTNPGTDTDTDTTPSEPGRTVANCETNIADDAPAFYKKYFRCVTITMDGDSVVIESDGLPPHASFYYETSDENYTEFVSQGDGFYQNPNRIEAQNIRMTIGSNPRVRGLTIDDSLVDGDVGSSQDEYGMGTQGVALNSVALFNPLAAPGDDIEDELYSFDPYYGHPAQGGDYHYHTTSMGPLEVLEAAGLTTITTPGSASIEIYGMMCDGTLILGCTELNGDVPDSSDFDSQNGQV